MRFLRSVLGVSRTDQLRNEEVRNILEIYNLRDKIEEYIEGISGTKVNKWRNTKTNLKL